MFIDRDVREFDQYLKNNPGEIMPSAIYDQDYEDLNSTINRLKSEGIIVDEKNANQNMMRR